MLPSRASGTAILPVMETIDVDIHTERIRLDGLLKFAAVVGTGGEAKQLIQAGRIRVNDVVETKRGRHVSEGDRVELIDDDGNPLLRLLVRRPTPP